MRPAQNGSRKSRSAGDPEEQTHAERLRSPFDTVGILFGGLAIILAADGLSGTVLGRPWVPQHGSATTATASARTHTVTAGCTVTSPSCIMTDAS